MDTWTIADTYEDGDATVFVYTCGCETVHAPTYTGIFACTTEHGASLADAVMPQRKAA